MRLRAHRHLRKDLVNAVVARDKGRRDRAAAAELVFSGQGRSVVQDCTRVCPARYAHLS